MYAHAFLSLFVDCRYVLMSSITQNINNLFEEISNRFACYHCKYMAAMNIVIRFFINRTLLSIISSIQVVSNDTTDVNGIFALSENISIIFNISKVSYVGSFV